MKTLRLVLSLLLLFPATLFAAVTVSSPANNSTVSSPASYVASATTTCSKGVASMGVYVNNKLIYVVNGASLNTAITLAAGAQHTVVEEWDKCGGATYTTINVTVGGGTPPPPPPPSGVTVTSPAANSTVTSPVQYVASAGTTCSKGVASMGIYVNNKLIYVVNGASLNTSITLANGAQHTVVEEWDKCGGASYTTVNLTVGTTAPVTTVAVSAKPATITAGASSVVTVTAANATKVTLTGSDGSSYSLPASGGTETVTPSATTTYTAVATGTSTSATAATTVTVSSKTVTAIAVSPSTASVAAGGTQQFTAMATYNDGTQGDVTSGATWTSGNATIATVNGSGLATGAGVGSTAITAAINTVSGSGTLTVTTPVAAGTNVLTWHYDNLRSGLNPNETSLTPTNVAPSSFGKLFSYLTDGYVMGEPLIYSGLTVNGATHNVVFAATEKDTVYAFDSDTYGSGTPLWQTSLLKSGETAIPNGHFGPWQGVTSTPVIDAKTNTMYVVSVQTGSSGESFRLNALDVTTGAQKFGGPVTITASVPGTNSSAVNGMVSLATSCIQRAALLLANGQVYIGFGSCHSGWLLSYDAHSLAQTGVFDVSPNLDGEGTYASAGGVWMGSGGPVADSSGNVYITTGNGPWDGKTAYADTVLKFDSTLNLQDYFTPSDYQYMDCADGDLAAGGLMMIPGTTEVVGGGKTGKLYLVNTGNMGHEQANDAGATQTIFLEAGAISPYSASCTDSVGTHTTMINSYEIFGTAAYYNGSIYLGATPTASGAVTGLRQLVYSGGQLSAGAQTSPGIQENTRGTTPFVSANGNTNGVVWMIDEGQPLSGAGTPSTATLRAYDAGNLGSQLYNSSDNGTDTPGYGLKFTSPVVANGKVYISTGHDLTTVANPKGELDVYGLK